MDLITPVIFVTFLNLSPPFWMCNIQLQRITAPSTTCLFFIHFCIVVGLILRVTLVLRLFFLKENGIELLLILLWARDISKTMETIVIHKGRACNLCCCWFGTEIHMQSVEDLGWRTLEQHRIDSRFTALFKFTRGLISVNSLGLLRPVMRRKLVSSEYLSFFWRTIIQWNNLPASVFSEHCSLDTFKAHVSCLNHLLSVLSLFFI